MKPKNLFLFALLVLNFTLSAQEPNLENLLPPDSAFENLTLSSEIESYVGDELFFLINGGADLYLEYGFKQVISAEYSNEAGNSLTIEIYEMKDRLAAYGIYSFQRMRDDKPDKIGDRGQIIKNNALLIKDRYVVKLFARFPEDKVEGLLKNTADLISAKIPLEDTRPLMLPYLLPIQDNDYPQVKFIRGNIALRNIYNFHNEDIFQIDDGVAGIYQEYTIFLFKYPGTLKAMQQFSIAQSKLEKEERYSSFYSQKNQFQMVDSRDNKIQVMIYDRYIIVFIYQGNRNLTPLVQEIKYNIQLAY
jgi:hypothetical protein